MLHHVRGYGAALNLHKAACSSRLHSAFSLDSPLGKVVCDGHNAASVAVHVSFQPANVGLREKS